MSQDAGASQGERQAACYYGRLPEAKKAREESKPVDADVRTGTKAHEIAATHVLSCDASVKEAVDNVLGIAAHDMKQLQVFTRKLPENLTSAAVEAAHAGKEHLFFFSNTRIDDDVWPRFFDQRPTSASDGDIPSHDASVFNRGIKDAFNKLTGGKDSNLFVFAQRAYSDRTGTKKYEFLVGRYGSALDNATGNAEDKYQRKLQFAWSMQDKAPLVSSGAEGRTLVANFCEGSAFLDDSQSKMKENINEVFLLLRERAVLHNPPDGYEEWFAVVMGPIGVVPSNAMAPSDEMPATGASCPILHKGIGRDGKDALLLFDPREKNRYVDLREVYAKSYVPASCEDSAVGNVQLFVEDSVVDMTANLWDENQNPATDKMDVVVGGSVVAHVQIKDVDVEQPVYGGFVDGRRVDPDGEPYRSTPQIVQPTAGILLALPGSGRFLSRDPSDFYKGHLFTQSPWKSSLKELINHFMSLARINSTTLRSQLRGLGISSASILNDERRMEDFCREVHKIKDKDRLWRALGARSLAMVTFTADAKGKLGMNHSKEQVEPTPEMKGIVGGILQTVLEHLFKTEIERLKRDGRAEGGASVQQKRRPSTTPAPGSSASPAPKRPRRSPSVRQTAEASQAGWGTQAAQDASMLRRSEIKQKARQQQKARGGFPPNAFERRRLQRLASDAEKAMEDCFACYDMEKLGPEDRDMYNKAKKVFEAVKQL